MTRISGLVALFLFLVVSPAHATQGHGGIEGTLVHQAAHVLFALAMGFLVFRIKRDELPVQRGWRNVQYAAFLFILWNLDAIFVHFVDEQVKLVTVQRLATGQLQITSPIPGLSFIYYIAKLDHLLCVPAIGFLWVGLRQLVKQAEERRDNGGAL
ncbi:hypothetical protein DSLASN_26290 [Desulfoluna limicola]|uniref:Uncharacterized protein n=1 Tax=Desulfoluna limicola TaxID=2810562 RepID=A0ABN6F6U1_9BACT|nr:hypothetical protein [Desulfoluna limicola]BCS96997.1 hypothetical protein DSLASN_26290 [Desulfoluna limicola]